MIRVIRSAQALLLEANASLGPLHRIAGALATPGLLTNAEAVARVDAIQGLWVPARELLGDHAPADINAAATASFGARAPADAHALLTTVHMAGAALVAAFRHFAAPGLALTAAQPFSSWPPAPEDLAAMPEATPLAKWDPAAHPEVTAAANAFRTAIEASPTVD